MYEEFSLIQKIDWTYLKYDIVKKIIKKKK